MLLWSFITKIYNTIVVATESNVNNDFVVERRGGLVEITVILPPKGVTTEQRKIYCTSLEKRIARDEKLLVEFSRRIDIANRYAGYFGRFIGELIKEYLATNELAIYSRYRLNSNQLEFIKNHANDIDEFYKPMYWLY